jgi:hypothetical protein
MPTLKSMASLANICCGYISKQNKSTAFFFTGFKTGKSSNIKKILAHVLPPGLPDSIFSKNLNLGRFWRVLK